MLKLGVIMPVEKPTDWVNSIVLSKTTNSKGEITKLRVLDGITGMADDMFVYGSSEEEHDRNLIKLMQRVQEKGIVFNKDRSQFKCKEVSFFEHSWSLQGKASDLTTRRCPPYWTCNCQTMLRIYGASLA